MRIIYFKKNAWTILFVLCIFVGGNIILFYKFMTRKNVERERAIKVALENNYRYLNTKNPAKTVDFLDTRRKYGSAKHDVKVEGKTDDFVTMEMRRQTAKERVEHESDTSQTERPMARDSNPSQLDYKFVILVIACNRPTAVKRCLDRLIKYRPSPEKFPIVVSQDCGHADTAAVIQSYGNQVQHIQQPDLKSVQGVPPNMVNFMGYYKISRHFKWALGQVFDVMKYETVIIVEDDLDIAPDFFEYFTATRPLLSQDPTLWCVSAWNDNGKEGMVQGSDLLYRTDFFSGLGWMITKEIWDELRPKWPLGFWDDWMRDPAQRRNRACIRPEICRTRTFGKVGVSRGQFFDQHLKFIKLNENSYPFTQTDLSYLLKNNYDEQFESKLNSLPALTVGKLKLMGSSLNEAKVFYSSKREFENIAHSLGAMTDFKAGVPRVAYQGVVIFMHQGVRVYLTPSQFSH